MFKDKNREFKFGVALIFIEILTFLVLLLLNLHKDLQSISILYILIVSFINICWILYLVARKYNDYDFESELLQNVELPEKIMVKLANKKRFFIASVVVLIIEALILVSLLITSMCISISLILMMITFTFINFVNLCLLVYLIANKQREEEIIVKLALENKAKKE